MAHFFAFHLAALVQNRIRATNIRQLNHVSKDTQLCSDNYVGILAVSHEMLETLFGGNGLARGELGWHRMCCNKFDEKKLI